MGWRGVGIGAAQHIVVTTGLGHSQAAGVSLASVLKEGEKKRSQLQKQQQRHRVSSSTSPRGPLEAGREDNKPQREQHEGSPRRKSDCRKPEQYELPCEQCKKWCRKQEKVPSHRAWSIYPKVWCGMWLASKELKGPIHHCHLYVPSSSRNLLPYVVLLERRGIDKPFKQVN